jgi:hypothetical protein
VASDNMCLLDKMRGNLRLMFSADSRYRKSWTLICSGCTPLRLKNWSDFHYDESRYFSYPASSAQVTSLMFSAGSGCPVCWWWSTGSYRSQIIDC